MWGGGKGDGQFRMEQTSGESADGEEGRRERARSVVKNRSPTTAAFLVQYVPSPSMGC